MLEAPFLCLPGACTLAVTSEMSPVGSLTTCLGESPGHPAFNPFGDTDATTGPLCHLFGMDPFGADDFGYCGFGDRHFENLSHLSTHMHAWNIGKSVDCQ